MIVFIIALTALVFTCFYFISNLFEIIKTSNELHSTKLLSLYNDLDSLNNKLDFISKQCTQNERRTEITASLFHDFRELVQNHIRKNINSNMILEKRLVNVEKEKLDIATNDVNKNMMHYEIITLIASINYLPDFIRLKTKIAKKMNNKTFDYSEKIDKILIELNNSIDTMK